jgi:hypothetical protein
VAALLTASASPLSGQSAFESRIGYGVSLGGLASVPDAFERAPCGSLLGIGVEADLTVHLGETVSLETTGAAFALSRGGCAVEEVPPPDNGTTRRNLYTGGVTSGPLVLLAERLVARPWAWRWGSPIVSAGAGWFVGETTLYWTAGLGLTLGRAGSGTSLHVERSSFRLPFEEEARVWVDGELTDVFTARTWKQRESMWLVRLRVSDPW